MAILKSGFIISNYLKKGSPERVNKIFPHSRFNLHDVLISHYCFHEVSISPEAGSQYGAVKISWRS